MGLTAFTWSLMRILLTKDWIVKGQNCIWQSQRVLQHNLSAKRQKICKTANFNNLAGNGLKWILIEIFFCLDKNDLMRFIIKIDLYVAERYWSSAYFKCSRAFFGKNSFVPILLFVTKSQITKFAILIFASQFVRRWRAELSTNLKGTAWNFQAKCVCNTFFFSG